MISFVNPTTFQHQFQQGQNPKIRGYPTQWQKPHWHGDNMYNPHLRVIMAEPDGTRMYYDPVTTTFSFEHSSGFHQAVLADGNIENSPGKKTLFVGGGGYTETITGQSDHTYGAHKRENYQADHYENYKGVHHAYYQQGAVSINMGNETHEHYGNVKHRVLGDKGAWGVGVGPGDGNYHDNAHTMTNKRIYTRAYTNSDMVQQTQSNSMYMASGKDHNTAAQQNINRSAKGAITDTGQQSAVLHSPGGFITIKADGDHIYLESSSPVWITQSDLWVSGSIHAGDFIVDPKPGNAQQGQAMPATPPTS